MVKWYVYTDVDNVKDPENQSSLVHFVSDPEQFAADTYKAGNVTFTGVAVEADTPEEAKDKYQRFEDIVTIDEPLATRYKQLVAKKMAARLDAYTYELLIVRMGRLWKAMDEVMHGLAQMAALKSKDGLTEKEAYRQIKQAFLESYMEM